MPSRVLDRLTTLLLDVGGRKGTLSKFTVASYVRSINVFLSWARREGEVGKGVKAQSPKPGLARFLRLSGSGNSVRLRVDRTAVAADQRLDGKFLLRTSDPTLSAEEIASRRGAATCPRRA